MPTIPPALYLRGVRLGLGMSSVKLERGAVKPELELNDTGQSDDTGQLSQGFAPPQSLVKGEPKGVPKGEPKGAPAASGAEDSAQLPATRVV